MHTSDLVADLRAEISMWWEGRAGAECGGSMLGSLLVGPALPPQPAQLRLISQGQEITPVGGYQSCKRSVGPLAALVETLPVFCYAATI